jgi:hypothetical protein
MVPLIFTNVDKASKARLVKLLKECLPNHTASLVDLGRHSVSLSVSAPSKGSKPKSGELALAKWISLVAGAKKATSIKIATSEDDRWTAFFDSFKQSLLDLKDLETLAGRKDGLACAIFAHALVEQFKKQVGNASYPAAHKAALEAEAEVLGATRYSDCYVGGYTGTVLCWKYPPKGEVRCLAFAEYRNSPTAPPKPIARPSKGCSDYLITQLNVLKAIIAGETEDPITALRIIRLLEEATGIAANTTESFAGRVYATEENLLQDVDAWSSWLEQNGERVRFDRATWSFYPDYSNERLSQMGEMEA